MAREKEEEEEMNTRGREDECVILRFLFFMSCHDEQNRYTFEETLNSKRQWKRLSTIGGCVAKLEVEQTLYKLDVRASSGDKNCSCCLVFFVCYCCCCCCCCVAITAAISSWATCQARPFGIVSFTSSGFAPLNTSPIKLM